MAEEIKNIISTILSNQNDWKIKLLQHWPEIIGQLKSKVVLEKINPDSLVIGVYDSCWLQELYLLSPILLTKINKKLETQCFKKLRFKQVDVKSYKKFEKIEPKNHKRTVILLTKREEVALEKIKDADLSNALRNFLTRCHTTQEMHVQQMAAQKAKVRESLARELRVRESQTRYSPTQESQTRESRTRELKARELQAQELKTWQFAP